MAANKNGNKKVNKTPNKKNEKSQKDLEREEILDSTYMDEIVTWSVAAVSLIVFLGNFGLCGFIAGLSNFCFSIFGAVQYIIPVALIFSAFFLNVNKYSKRAIVKVVLLVVVLFFISILSQIFYGLSDVYNFIDYFKQGFYEHSAGGIVGGTLAFLLNKLVGRGGTIILALLAIIVCVIFFCEISVIDVIRRIITAGNDEEDEYDEYDDYDRELERENKRENKRLKKNRKNKEDKRIVVEDFPKEENANTNANRSILDSISIISENGEKPVKINSTNKEDIRAAKKKAKEDVHEIKATRGVGDLLLPGERMSDVSKKPEDVDEGGVSSLSAPDETDDDNVVSIIMDEETNDSVRSKKIVEPLMRKGNTDYMKDEEEIKTPVKRNASPSKKLTEDKFASAKDYNESSGDYRFPPLNLLKQSKSQSGVKESDIRANAAKLQQVLESFGVNVTITNYSCGPSVTRYEMVPEVGVKVSKITGLADDLMMNLAAQSIRIEAPIPGKSAVGIEIPNEKRAGVGFRELIEAESFKSAKSKITFAVGKDIEGNVIVEDIAKMPHLLIAGATGSGKSVCTNTLIMSILYKATPDEVQMILIDPKQVELKVYNGIPHLMVPVVTDPKKAAGALNWAVAEMNKRYEMFSEYNVRNIQGYNEKVEMLIKDGEIDEESPVKKLPQIVIIVDELADLMMVARSEVEDAIVRLTQLARAAGIHLVIATQRPSVDVVTGLIKANVPSRIALSVSSQVDSRTIIDSAGAEKLLGNGDMLFAPTSYPQPLRVQGAYISDEEVNKVVEFVISKNGKKEYSKEMDDQISSHMSQGNSSSSSSGSSSDGEGINGQDEYFLEAGKFIIEKNKASIGMLQRMFRIGFNRAARIMDQLADAGVVGPEEGTKPRQVIMTMEEFEAYVDEYL